METKMRAHAEQIRGSTAGRTPERIPMPLRMYATAACCGVLVRARSTSQAALLSALNCKLCAQRKCAQVAATSMP